MIREIIPSKLQIRLLGEFYLLVDGNPVPGLNADRPQSLLAYLLLHRDAPKSRQHLAFLLWPDSSEAQARTNLRNLLHTLRHALPGADTFLTADTATVQWQANAPYELDVAHFEAALQQATQTDDPEIIQQCLETAVSLYQGDLLPGNYDDWLIPIREELRQKYLEALARLVGLLEGRGAFRQAARYCQRLLHLDPFDETAAVQLMRLQALGRDKAGVQRTYQTLVTALQRELGVAPSEATQEAYTQLLQLKAGPSQQPTAITLPEWRPRALPLAPTLFIGRETELAEIAASLADPECRLLTILGLGGMGKTRLALQTAVGHQTVFRDGVAFASLTPLRSADHIIPTLAESLNFSLAGSADLISQLLNFLRQKEILLVLDNFEHLLESATLLADILAQASGVKILATSRQRLDLLEEWVFEIQGLPTLDQSTDSLLEANSAALLFVQSAKRIRHNFALTKTNQSEIQRICGLVDGMPLGLELAASWVRSLSCAEIANEIERNRDFLTISSRNIEERHRSMRAVFDHSWHLLSSSEQQVLSRLSVFQGGFIREAAKQVADANLVTLSALVDKSLLQRTTLGRFALHELVRQYAATWLQTSTEVEGEIRQCHADYYLTMLQKHEAQLQSPQQNAATTTLLADIDNIRSAWEQAVVTESFTLLRQAAYPLWYLYELRNYFQEGESRMAYTAAVVEAYLAQHNLEKQSANYQEMTALLGELWAYHGFCAIHLGRGQAALDLTTAAANLMESIEVPRSQAYALCLHVMILRTKSRYEESIQNCHKGLHLSRELGLRWQEAIFLATLGAAAHDLGDYAQAYTYLNEALSISRAIGDPRHIAYIGNLLSHTAQILGHSSEVEDLLQEIIILTTEIGDRLGVGMALEQLARLASSAGDEQRAQTLFEECVAMYAKSGDAFHLTQALNQFGHFLLNKGSYEEAHAAFIRACQMADPMGVFVPVLDALTGLAVLHLQDEKREQALEIICYIQEHPDSSAEAQKRAAQIREGVLQVLSPAQVAAVQAKVVQRPFTAWLQEEVRRNGR